LKDGSNGTVVRRRRSWYRRRLRRQRTFAVAVLFLLIAAVCWQNVARLLRLPSLRISSVLPDSFQNRNYDRQNLALAPAQAARQRKYVSRISGVYPYSVVPGGVRDSQSLQALAARDSAVARHYAHFDYRKAHLVRVTEPRDVYVSYRIRDTIFWTHKKIRLLPGEPLLTDGNITARAKCGNQISETAKPDVSDQEPDEDVLDQPVALEPLGPSLPLHPAFRPDLPIGQPPPAGFYAGGFSFPYAPVAGPFPAVCRFRDGAIDKHCHPHHKPPKTPEPATFALIASGMAMILWRYKKHTSPVAAHTAL
jgi:hypothetical protein